MDSFGSEGLLAFTLEALLHLVLYLPLSWLVFVRMHGVLLLGCLVEVDLLRVSSYSFKTCRFVDWNAVLYIRGYKNVRLPKYIPITDFLHFHLICHMLHMLHALDATKNKN